MDTTTMPVRAKTADRPTEEEGALAGRIGLPAAWQWTVGRRPESGRELISLGPKDIAVLGGFEVRRSLGDGPSFAVEPLRSENQVVEAAAGLLGHGADEDRCGHFAMAAAACADPAHFIVAAGPEGCRGQAAVLHVRRGVTVESDEDDVVHVDYDVEVIDALAAGSDAGFALAACHAALALQFDVDVKALAFSLCAVGYDREVLSNVSWVSPAMRDPAVRIASLLAYRQDVAREFAVFGHGGFPAFREPAVLDL